MSKYDKKTVREIIKRLRLRKRDLKGEAKTWLEEMKDDLKHDWLHSAAADLVGYVSIKTRIEEIDWIIAELEDMLEEGD